MTPPAPAPTPAAPETPVSGAAAVSRDTRVETIANVLLQHTFDHDLRECMCGHTGGLRRLAGHVAQQIDTALFNQPQGGNA